MDSRARRTCWAMAIVAGLPAGQRAAWLTMLSRDRQRVDQGENMMVPLQVLLHAACRGIIINYITTKMSLLIEITQNISKRASNKKWPPCNVA